MENCSVDTVKNINTSWEFPENNLLGGFSENNKSNVFWIKNNSPNSITLSQKFIDAFNRTKIVEIKKKPISNNLIFLPILISLGIGS